MNSFMKLSMTMIFVFFTSMMGIFYAAYAVEQQEVAERKEQCLLYGDEIQQWAKDNNLNDYCGGE